jgi:hypothetical protein
MVLLPRFAFQASQPPSTALTSIILVDLTGLEPASSALNTPNKLRWQYASQHVTPTNPYFGASCRTLTHNLRVRSAMLYTVELMKQIWCPRPGFEPATYRLQGGCSTTELQGQNFCGSLYVETLLTPQGDQVGKL